MAAFMARTDKEGKTRITAIVRLRGLPRQSATFPNKTLAKRWATQVEADLREGRYFKQSQSQRHSLEDLIERFLDELELKEFKSLKQYRQILSWWSSELGYLKLSDLSSSLISDQKTKLFKETTLRSKRRSPARVNRYLAVLSSALSVAVKEWEWLEENPALKVSKYKEPIGRVRYLKEDERERLVKACKESDNEDLLLAFLMALSTGARRMEIWGIKWSDIDLEKGRIVFEETKNKERKGVHLYGTVLELLRTKARSKHKNAVLLFPSLRKPHQPINFRKSFEVALKAAQIKDFTWHDIRHTTASYLAMQGASSSEIASVLGHKSLDMVKRYAHISEEHNSEILKRLNQSLF